MMKLIIHTYILKASCIIIFPFIHIFFFFLILWSKAYETINYVQNMDSTGDTYKNISWWIEKIELHFASAVAAIFPLNNIVNDDLLVDSLEKTLFVDHPM